MAIIKAGAEPRAELAAFLRPFGELLSRKEIRHALERYTTGLLSDLDRKTAAGMGRALPGTNDQRLPEFLPGTDWEAAEMDRMRIGQMLSRASVGQGVSGVDDTGFGEGRALGRRGAAVFGHAGALAPQQSYGPAVLEQRPNAPARGFPPQGAKKPGHAPPRRARSALSTGRRGHAGARSAKVTEWY